MPKPRKLRSVQDVAGVPNYEILQLHPKQHDFLVCVFVINEGARIQNQLVKMGKFSDLLDIVVADGGSTDDSLEPAFLQTTKTMALLTKTGKGKLSAQMRMAFHYALQGGYRGVITIDGNGKDGLDAMPEFVRLLAEGYDHIQGSRYIPGGHHENTPIARHLALKILHAPLISLASKTHQTDTTNGFRAYSSRLLADKQIAVFREVFDTYELHYHLAIESGLRAKFKNIETPVSRVYPPKGKIPTKISPIRGSFQVLSILFKAVLGKYKSQEI